MTLHTHLDVRSGLLRWLIARRCSLDGDKTTPRRSLICFLLTDSFGVLQVLLLALLSKVLPDDTHTLGACTNKRGAVTNIK